jgi:hypothetical protein
VAPRPRPTIVRRALVALPALVLTMGAAACGGSPSGRAATPAATLLLQSESALARASIVHINGRIVEKSGSSTDSLTVVATSAGSTSTSEGTLDLEGPGLGFTGSTRYVVVGSTTWVNGTTAFWKSYFGSQSPTVVRLETKVFPQLVGHWIELAKESTEVMYKDALGLSEPRVFVTGILRGLKGTLTNSGNETVNGLSGVQITSSTGGKILVAGSGSPLPIGVADSTSESGNLSVDLAVSYPASVTISAPAHFAVLLTVLRANAHT